MIERGSPCDADIQPETISKRLRWIESVIGESSNLLMLDLGCGKGVYDQALAKRGMRIIGIDFDAQSLAFCKVKNAFGGEYLRGVAESLPFNSGIFDAVIVIEVLEHVFDFEKTIVEISRVLKPGGILLSTVPNRGFPFLTHGFHLGKKHFDNFFGFPLPLATYLPLPLLRRIWLARHFRAAELNRSIEKAGLDVLDVRFLSPAFEIMGGASTNSGLAAWLRKIMRRFDLNPKFWPGMSIATHAIKK